MPRQASLKSAELCRHGLIHSLSYILYTLPLTEDNIRVRSTSGQADSKAYEEELMQEEWLFRVGAARGFVKPVQGIGLKTQEASPGKKADERG